MEKVKLTKLQAEAVKALVNIHSDIHEEREIHELLIKEKFNGGWESSRFAPAGDISHFDFIDALRYGFEVEETFKVGDWVVWHGDVVKIKYPQTEAHKDNGKCYFTIERSDKSTYTNILRSNIRPATPEEIKAEKERRLWAKIGRGANEWKIGDKYIAHGRDFTIRSEDWIKAAKSDYEKGIITTIYPVESRIEFGGEGE